MSDILDDYREWAAEQPQHVSTHSDRCHMWPRHEACMIHRLAVEIERLRLTDAEREAIAWVCGDVADITGPIEKTLRGLLERHCPTSETRSLQDNDPSASENLPTGNDTQKKHCNSDKFTDR